MRFYLAPMEGITNIRFRKHYFEHFGDADRYFTPFLVGKNLSKKEKAEVSPADNAGMELVPQILTNKAEDFVYVADHLYDDYGYTEVNLNLGCPSSTVANKNRGSGFLRILPQLEEFLDYIYTHAKPGISIKTRIGVTDSTDWEKILALYCRYPLTELIVHPRTTKQGYGGRPDIEAFARAVCVMEEHAKSHARIPLCYNGDINSPEDYRAIIERFPQIDAVMCGRGLIADPFLLGELKGKEGYSPTEDPARFRAYVDALFDEYKNAGLGERNSLFKLKELWLYFSRNFPDPQGVLRPIQKANSHLEFEAAVNQAFRSLSEQKN